MTLTIKEWIFIALAAGAVLVPLLAWLFPRRRNTEITISNSVVHFYLSEGPESSTIHSTNGVPTLQQLTEDIDPNAYSLAQSLYEIGLEQFNHYVNNRDSVIEESRREIANLTNYLSGSEISAAEKMGILLATANSDEQRKEAQAQYNNLSPQAQIYAQCKHREYDAQRRIAKDLEKSIPRTDYTSVKSRIAAGDTPLTSIVNELPVPWQDIRTLNSRPEKDRVTDKPPKREFVHVEFYTRERGILEDKRAERDGDWIISNKHKMLVPYMEPAIVYEFRNPNSPPVPTGKKVVIYTQDPGTEWETEFWRQGGYLDQTYLRAKKGKLPEQLRSAYRRRQINRVGWIAGTAVLIADIILFVTLYL